MQIVTLLLSILQNLGKYKAQLTMLFAGLLALNAQFHFLNDATMQSLIAIAVGLGIWTVNDGTKKVEAKVEAKVDALDEKWSNE